jgi:hypothetical protein
VKEIAAKPNVDWEKLNPAIKVVLVDLCYRGDYTAAARVVLGDNIMSSTVAGCNAFTHLWDKLFQEMGKSPRE